jgi:GGDEF domain-containing protein
MVDVDHFQAYNDHAMAIWQGDACLRGRRGAGADTDAAIVARYGGGECALFARTSMEHASTWPRSCAAGSERSLPHLIAPSGHVTVSVGVALRARATRRRR